MQKILLTINSIPVAWVKFYKYRGMLIQENLKRNVHFLAQVLRVFSVDVNEDLPTISVGAESLLLMNDGREALARKRRVLNFNLFQHRLLKLKQTKMKRCCTDCSL